MPPIAAIAAIAEPIAAQTIPEPPPPRKSPRTKAAKTETEAKTITEAKAKGAKAKKAKAIAKSKAPAESEAAEGAVNEPVAVEIVVHKTRPVHIERTIVHVE